MREQEQSPQTSCQDGESTEPSLLLSVRSLRAKCCSKEMFYHRKIQESRIVGYLETPSTCTHRAVFVKLLKGMVCVDPDKKWFQEYLRKQKNPNSTST
ncbi:hypothetical protein EK904_010102 [Melospiza melodia maxima]|nr:hypothetical protein EK904_010102 [Melospiza melodia maxima]